MSFVLFIQEIYKIYFYLWTSALFNTMIFTHWLTLRSDPFVFRYVDTLYIILTDQNTRGYSGQSEWSILVSHAGILVSHTMFTREHCVNVNLINYFDIWLLPSHLNQPHKGHLTSEFIHRRFTSYLPCTLLLFPFHLLTSPVHPTGVSLGFFPGFLVIFSLLSSQQQLTCIHAIDRYGLLTSVYISTPRRNMAQM